jgi:hypothetical protein
MRAVIPVEAKPVMLSRQAPAAAAQLVPPLANRERRCTGIDLRDRRQGERKAKGGIGRREGAKHSAKHFGISV